ncbi:(2,3-dihydroxybenzoyl)adenylate synthase [Pseudonocardia sp. GCM10023141]|uniref:(2,3-dihydroxybenzoyl)adenylate synthase n=1 Tax=Pseudonocardia sp. GCM10023141 TaxID=3252653 RepID=UPI00360EA845
MTDTGASDDGFTPWPADAVARYRRAGHWGDATLGELLRVWAERSGAAVAVVGGVERLTYAELDRRADAVARGLVDLGIAPGDRVLVHLPNTADFVVTLFGMLRAGAVPALALPAHRRVEIEHLATLAGAVAYLVPASHGGFDHLGLGAEILAAVPSVRHVLVTGADPASIDEAGPAFRSVATIERNGAGSSATLPAVDPAAVAVLLVSGGTTGNPKLIPRTHRDYAYNARASAEVCALGPQDVYLVCLPAAHNFPLACPGLLGALGAGAIVVMCPVPGPEIAFALIEQERVTVTALVPPLVRLWVDAAAWEQADRSSLRLLQVGGAKLDAALAGEVPDALGCALQQVFGMAEGLLNYTRLDDPFELVRTTQGRPLSVDDELRIVDDAGADVAPGVVGELFTRGPYTLRGYYRAAAYNATAFTPDGWFRTGDLVRQLPSGHLVVEGRVKDVINRGGENVSAVALEEHLLAHPDIAGAAVIGLPDPVLGERVCAVLTLAAPIRVGEPARSLKRKEVTAWLRARGLASFMLPDLVVVQESLPLTGVGKIDKRRLATELGPDRVRT